MDIFDTLTELDKSILRKSWQLILKNLDSVSVAIFRMIFEQSPDARLMFTFMKYDPSSNTVSNDFKFHSLRFTQAIDSVMLHLDNPHGLNELFDNLGKIHARLQEQRGFR
ncbi:unnamed protein product [Anisakis simplex]|uniref:Globin (inferred by orthology to a C. elegans protein) n=1 Tax=Anisakis simplex TaxID=6269 RepID=A0A0M3JAH6_ANISI|nr:unnamed protein product [Anisakis simplex]VDK23792.1 unnamed protein product [Anisakis simplex]